MPDNSCSLLASKCCGWLNQLSVNRFCWEIMRVEGVGVKISKLLTVKNTNTALWLQIFHLTEQRKLEIAGKLLNSL